LDLIKELLAQAYEATDEKSMKIAIDEIMDLCEATGNKHFLWFKRLLENHMFGIITHATHNISSGKIEGLNHVIKNVRRQGYGYPDDEYFFLKLFDASRRSYERNPSALKIPQVL
jgi:transposase